MVEAASSIIVATSFGCGPKNYPRQSRCARTGHAALEKAKAEKEVQGEFETECPGYCGAQDTFYVGTLKGVGRVYQQTFIDTYAKVGVAKLYDRKTRLWPPIS
jgi:hypothetical protein